MVSDPERNLQSILDAVAAGEPSTLRLLAPTALPWASNAAPGRQRAHFPGDRDYADRSAWNRALEERIASYEPDYIVFAGFMRIVDAAGRACFSNRIINTHPALLPSFPGARRA